MLLKPVCASLLFAVGASVAQEPAPWQKTTVCDRESVALQIVSLKRSGPGVLVLTFQLENSSNVPVTPGSKIQLYDDAGNEWSAYGGTASPFKFPPSIKVTSKLTFKRDTGGNDAKTATLSSQLLVHVLGNAKNLGTCAWTVKDIPIQ